MSAPAAQTAQTMQTAPVAQATRAVAAGSGGPASPGPDAVRADLIAAAAQQLTGTDQGQRLARARRGEVCGALAPETGVRIEAWGPATTVLLMPGTSLTRPPEARSESGDAPVAVVVVDGSVPLGADELAVLAGLALPAAQVVLVVDRGAGPAAEGERDGVRAASRAVLAEYAPGFGGRPMLPAEDGPALTAAITAARAWAGERDLTAAVAVSALDWQAARCRREIARLSRRGAPDEAAAAERDALQRMRAELTGAQGLPARLSTARTEFAAIRVELGHLAAARTRRLTTTARTELETCDRGGLAVYPDRLAGRIDAAAAELTALAAHRLGAPVDPLPAPGPVPEPVDGRRFTAEDRLVLAMGASAGLGVSRMLLAPLALVPALRLAVLPVMLALGLAAAWWIVRARTVTADRQRMRARVAETLAEVRGEWERALARAVLAAEAAQLAETTAAHTAELADCDARLRRIDAAAGERAAERDRRAVEAGRRSAALEHLAAELADRARIDRAGRR